MGEERERCGEFGTKAAACIVNGKLHGVSRLDCVSLVVVHMAEFTPFLLNLLLLRVYFSIMTRLVVGRCTKRRFRRKIGYRY